MQLDYEEVARRRAQNRHGLLSTSEIERSVARKQMIEAVEAIGRIEAGPASDPRVDRLIDVLAFGLLQGVL